MKEKHFPNYNHKRYNADMKRLAPQEIEREFCVDSAIPKALFDTAVSIIPDIEIDETTQEVISTPIADALGWKFTRFTHQARANHYAANFVQESGGTWQLKLFDGSREYRAPTGIGDIPYLPRVPLELGEQIARHYGVEPPEENESLWDWLKRTKEVPLVITEGGKKALSIIGIGIPAIALYGCLCGARTKDGNGQSIAPRLTPELLPLAKDRIVYIAFDQDIKTTAKKAVGKGIKRLGRALKRAGAKPFVISWNPALGKGADDLIASHGPKVFYEALRSAAPFEIHELEQLVRLTYTPSLEINIKRINHIELPFDKRFIALISAKGSGKTELIAKEVRKHLKRGHKVLVVTHRVKLGEELAARLGVKYVSEIWCDELGKTVGFCLCIDSLHVKSQAAFNVENWADTVVIIDEVEQVIQHLLCAHTSVEKYRPEILENFHRLMEIAKKVIIAEADICDRTIDYLMSLNGGIEPWILLNEWTPEEGYQVTHFDWKNPDLWLYSLVRYIEDGGRPFIFLDSQKTKSKWSTKNIERLLKKLFPELKILRIDSETLKDPNHPAFGCMSNLNEVLLNYHIVITSPCVETGVSLIIEEHFSSVWAKSEGVQTSNAFRQALIRLRAYVPRFLYIAPLGKQKGETSPNQLIQLAKRGHKNIVKLLGELDDSNLQYQSGGNHSKHLRTWAMVMANINAQSYHYRNYTLFKLKQEGHKIQHLTLSKKERQLIEPGIEIISGMLDEVKEGHYAMECEEFAEERNPSDKELERLMARNVKTIEEQKVERKGILSRRYKEENVTPEIVAQDDAGMYYELQLHFWLSVGRTFLEERDIERIKSRLKDNEGKLFIPDSNRDAYIAKVTILELLGIPELLARDRDTEFRNDDETITHIADTARSLSKDIHASFNQRIPSNSSNLGIVQMFLGKLGLKMPCLRREGKRGERQRVYGFPVSKYESDQRETFFEYWREKEAQKRAKESVSTAPPEPAFEGEFDSSTPDEERDTTRVHGSVYIVNTPPSRAMDTEEKEIREVISWLNAAVQNEMEGLRELIDTVQSELPHLRRKLWARLGTIVKQAIADYAPRGYRWLAVS